MLRHKRMQLPADVVKWPEYGVWTEHDKKFLCGSHTRIAVSIITCPPKIKRRVLSLVVQLLNARKLFTLFGQQQENGRSLETLAGDLCRRR